MLRLQIRTCNADQPVTIPLRERGKLRNYIAEAGGVRWLHGRLWARQSGTARLRARRKVRYCSGKSDSGRVALETSRGMEVPRYRSYYPCECHPTAVYGFSVIWTGPRLGSIFKSHFEWSRVCWLPGLTFFCDCEIVACRYFVLLNLSSTPEHIKKKEELSALFPFHIYSRMLHWRT